MNGLLELLTNKHWMIAPDYVRGIRSMLQHNLNTHATLNLPEKVMGYPVSAKGGRIIADNGRYDKVNEPFVNLEIINGPITRNGDACSYGSRDHRDMMMMAADSPYCLGHVFLINTPGGSAWAKNDYQQAIDYAHQKGQKVYAFIDGMCASAGMYLASMCDGRYYMNGEDEIGCIGVMAAFYSVADGSKNQFTDETYHEFYDPESFDKNRQWRDVANDGNADEWIKELAELGVEFRAAVKKACPNAQEEHLHGKIFRADDVKGILVDEQKMLSEVIALAAQNEKVQKQFGNNANSQNNNMSNQNAETEMKEKFPAIFALLGTEEVACNEEGSFLNADLLATLNGKIQAMQEENAQAKELAEQLTAKNSEIEQLKTDHEAAINQLNTEHATALEEKGNQISALEQEKADLQSDMEGKASQIETLTADLNGAKESLTTAQNTIAERDQQISDLNATIDEMKQDAGAPGAASPANNGEGAEQAKVVVGCYVYNNDLTYEQNLEAEEKWNKEHGK